VDENVREEPLFVPFLGTVAATGSTAARLHRLTGAPLVVVTCQRTGVGRFRYHVWKIIRHTPTEDREADLLAITREMYEGLSRAVRSYPDQWFWGSRRFLTRPPGEVPGPDGLPPAEGQGRRDEPDFGSLPRVPGVQ
jgi:KDO2-lipid IV(A) lauroyltransferase